MRPVRRQRSAAAWCAGFLLGAPCFVCAQDAPPPSPREAVKMPDLAEPVLKLLEASYLTDDERRDLRIFHGVWNEDDLNTPQRRATAALIRGAFDDPSLADPNVAIEDRAEAMRVRGEFAEAIDLLGPADSVRAERMRAECYEGLGRADEAAKALEPLVAKLKAQELTTAADLVEGVRGLMIRARVRPQEEPAGGDFGRMNTLLATARDKLGRLYWPSYLAEGRLLHEKDNSSQGVEAIAQCLGLNPSSAEAWLLLGQIQVDGFNFDEGEKAAERLNRLCGGASPYGAIVLARSRLRQNDPDGAAAVIEPMLVKFPKMRPLLALQASVAALRYDAEKTDQLLGAFDALSPGSPDALFEVGRTLSEARQYDAAAKYLGQAAARAPLRAESETELGLLGLQSGHDIDALDALKKAHALDPFNTRVDNSLKLVQELAKYDRIETDHFIVRYRPGVDEVLAREMVRPLETMYKRVTGKGVGGIDHEPKGKTVIDLMPDQRWFAVRIAGITRIHTMAASTGPTIAMEAPREGASHSVGTYDWLRVVRHEFTHTVTLSRTRNRIPHWFTEAAAVYLEDAPRDYRTCRLLQDALDNDGMFDFSKINIAFVRPRKPTDRPLAYAQGHWMYQFMIEHWSPRAPLDLMDHYALGEREDAAMRAVLGMGEEQFLTEFKSWAAQQLVEWGLGKREDLPSVGQILLAEAARTESGRASVEGKLQQAADDVAWSSAAGGGPEPSWEIDLPSPDDAMLKRWLERYPDHPDLLEATVKHALRDSGNKPSDQLAPLLERYAKARPVDPLPHQMLATLYLGKTRGTEGGGPELAIPHLEYLDAREQNSASYAAELARQYAAIEQWDKATAKAERACIVAPYNADYRELAASIALQHKDYAAALRHITALTKLEPDRPIHRKRLEALQKLMAAQ